MDVEIPPNTEEDKFDLLPTGKRHISFSEMNDWSACSYRHKLKFIDKLTDDRPALALDFGTCCHAAIEDFMKTRVMKPSLAIDRFKDCWKANNKNTKYMGSDEPEKQKNNFVSAITQLQEILDEFPSFLEKSFSGWEFISAEERLYEPSSDRYNHAFKGFIDIVISVETKGKKHIWILDAKTCGFGWKREKKQDPRVIRQLALYKYFWSKKFNVDLKSIRTAFVLLKKQAKTGQRCELYPVSTGPVSTARHLKVINDMFSSVNSEIAVKNRTTCEWCDFRNTENCSGYVFDERAVRYGD